MRVAHPLLLLDRSDTSASRGECTGGIAPATTGLHMGGNKQPCKRFAMRWDGYSEIGTARQGVFARMQANKTRDVFHSETKHGTLNHDLNVAIERLQTDGLQAGDERRYRGDGQIMLVENEGANRARTRCKSPIQDGFPTSRRSD